MFWSLSVASQIEWINYKNTDQFHDAFSAIDNDQQYKPWAGTLLNGIIYFNGTAFNYLHLDNNTILQNEIYDLYFDIGE